MKFREIAGGTAAPARGKDALLVLSDGSFFRGKNFGAQKDSIGELVFTTAMTGYQEAVTDPSYAGQILTFCYPLEGNYGTNKDDFESEKVHARAVVAKEMCLPDKNLHYKSQNGFSEFLTSFNVPGISGVDTRAIVRKVRSEGVMPASIAVIDSDSSEKAILEKVSDILSKIRKYDYGSFNFVSEVSPKAKKILSPVSKKHGVALIDCGCKTSIVSELLKRNLEVTVFPFNVSAKEIMESGAEGAVFSNGPGNPALLNETVACAKSLLGKLPIFGICLGNQILGIALGGETYKLKFGHRGANHAVRNLETGKVYITSQNHGFAVRNCPKNVKELFVNCNDNTNEGLRCEELNAFSVQFHPEGSCGPKDSNYLFDEFVKKLWRGK